MSLWGPGGDGIRAHDSFASAPGGNVTMGRQLLGGKRCQDGPVSSFDHGLLSVVIPCYNEIAVLPLLEERLLSSLADVGMPWEVVFVDDGSHDGTYERLAALTAADPRFKRRAPLPQLRPPGRDRGRALVGARGGRRDPRCGPAGPARADRHVPRALARRRPGRLLPADGAQGRAAQAPAVRRLLPGPARVLRGRHAARRRRLLPDGPARRRRHHRHARAPRLRAGPACVGGLPPAGAPVRAPRAGDGGHQVRPREAPGPGRRRALLLHARPPEGGHVAGASPHPVLGDLGPVHPGLAAPRLQDVRPHRGRPSGLGWLHAAADPLRELPAPPARACWGSTSAGSTRRPRAVRAGWSRPRTASNARPIASSADYPASFRATAITEVPSGGRPTSASSTLISAFRARLATGLGWKPTR